MCAIQSPPSIENQACNTWSTASIDVPGGLPDAWANLAHDWLFHWEPGIVNLRLSWLLCIYFARSTRFLEDDHGSL